MQKSRLLAVFPGLAILGVLVSLGSVNNASGYTENQSGIQFGCFQTDESTGDYLLDDEGNLIPCEINSGDNAWMLTASALVLVMTPAGLSMFYGGLARHKNAVGTIHMVFMAVGLVTVQWVLWGYSLAFGPDATGHGFIGNFDWAGLNYVFHDVPSDVYAITIPHMTFMVFQMMFAIITPALIVAALAERMKWSAYVVFVVIWATFVYDFAAHWTWSLGTGGTAVGWTGALPSLDFAGGTVIHITSGWAGLVIAIMLGRRLGYGKVPMEPHNIPLIVLGAALLWFGWFGFNGGSAGASGNQRNQRIRCNSDCNWSCGFNLDVNFLGAYRKTIHSWSGFRSRSRVSSNYACFRFCRANGFDHNRHCCIACLLCSSCIQEPEKVG